MARVNVVWLEGPLTELARMSLASYLRHGCEVTLWTYDRLGQYIEPGVQAAGADLALPRSELDRYRFHPSGQMALACDLLSWNVSRRHGGWMGHLDVTLMKPLPEVLSTDYVLGPHHRYAPSFALWHAPQGSEMVARALASKPVPPLTDWHAMLRTMSYAASSLGLLCKVTPTLVNNDSSEDPIEAMCREGSELHAGWENLTAVHWMGSGRIRGLNIYPDSYFARLRDDLLISKNARASRVITGDHG